VASADRERHGEHQKQRAGYGGTNSHEAHSEDGRRRTRQRQSSGAQRPSVLLAARVVHATPPHPEEPEPITRRSPPHTQKIASPRIFDGYRTTGKSG
jgi:hypothetical protein